MPNEPLDALLDKLSTGDDAAAREAFLVYEPYLRKVVRRQLSGRLRTKFDSIDVVQSVWADVVQGFRESGWRFADTDHLRAFLIKLTRNRFIDRFRRHQTALEREQRLGDMDLDQLASSSQPSPSEVAQADDLWQKMLSLCPPAHRQLLELKRQGLSLAEIVEQTGLHEGSIRRILRNLARQLALEQKPLEGESTQE